MTVKVAIAAGTLAAAFALSTSGAQAQSIGQNLFQKLLGTGDDQPAINYSERAPLVIPPKRDMPAPVVKQSEGEDPNWPKDPDENKRRKQQASADSRGPASGNTELLSQDELAVGTRAGGSADQKNYSAAERDYNHMANPVNPKVLAKRGNFGPPVEPLVPGQEPPRRNLIDPPTGMRTPLATAPLGGDEPLPSEVDADANKPWYQKLWK